MLSLSPTAVSESLLNRIQQPLTENDFALDFLGEAREDIRQGLAFSGWVTGRLFSSPFSFSSANHALHLTDDLSKSIFNGTSFIGNKVAGALANNDLLNSFGLQVPTRTGNPTLNGTGRDYLGASEVTQRLGATLNSKLTWCIKKGRDMMELPMRPL